MLQVTVMYGRFLGIGNHCSHQTLDLLYKFKLYLREASLLYPPPPQYCFSIQIINPVPGKPLFKVELIQIQVFFKHPDGLKDCMSKPGYRVGLYLVTSLAVPTSNKIRKNAHILSNNKCSGLSHYRQNKLSCLP